MQHTANHLQEQCHSSHMKAPGGCRWGWVLHFEYEQQIPLWQLRLHSSALTYKFGQDSAVWWKLCCCRHAPVDASDGQVMPTWAAVQPLCWLIPENFCFPNVLPFQRRPVVQHWACKAWPNFTYSSMDILVTWCFYSGRVIMILSGVKLYL